MENQLKQELSLDGGWQFSLGEPGEKREILAPGCWEAQGVSKWIDGPAVYRRSVRIPPGWQGASIFIELGAVSYACRVKCNDIEVGAHQGMWTPFSFEITGAARPGEENLLEVEVYKPGTRYPMRASLAGFLPDVATTFGGIWQSARLAAYRAAIEDLEIVADPQGSAIHVHCKGLALKGNPPGTSWSVSVRKKGRQQRTRDLRGNGSMELAASLPVRNFQWWTPENPALYTVRVEWQREGEILAAAERRVGFRSLSAQGKALLFNRQPWMVRGILSWGWEPERIAPFYTRQQARDEIKKVKALGFNLIKLCLFLPNPDYFEVADEEGMPLWVELPMWLPEVGGDWKRRIPPEYEDLAKLVWIHPSVVIYSLGCELSQSVDAAMLSRLNDIVRARASGALVCDNSGSGESYGGLEVDFSDFTDYHPYYDLHYFEPLLDNWRRDWQRERPWIFGEFCDSDTFHDQGEIVAANGGRKPWWLTRDNPVTAWRSEAQAAVDWSARLDEARPGFDPHAMQQVSYRQSYVVRKYTLEALRRRSGMGGYIITGLRDTPISTSGVWDDLGRAKWTAEEFKRINGDDVLCLEVGRRRAWRNGGDHPAPIDPHNLWAGADMRWYLLLHCAREDFPAGAEIAWSLETAAGEALASGGGCLEQAARAGNPAMAAVIAIQAPEVARPAQYLLRARVSQGARSVENEWPVWVYPRLTEPPADLAVYDPPGLLESLGDWLKPVPRVASLQVEGGVATVITSLPDDRLWAHLSAGGKGLLIQMGAGPLPARALPFWREGIKLFAEHPLWRRFPHQGYADMQFFALASDLAFDTPRLPHALPSGAAVQPILRRMDAREFHVTDYLFEARIGTGRLIGCTLNLKGGAGAQPISGPRNVSGAAMLRALVETLQEDA